MPAEKETTKCRLSKAETCAECVCPKFCSLQSQNFPGILQLKPAAVQVLSETTFSHSSERLNDLNPFLKAGTSNKREKIVKANVEV